MLTYARVMTAAQLEKTCRKFASVQKLDGKATPADLAHDRYVSRQELDDGRVSFRIVLLPDEVAMFSTMLDHQATRLANVSAETPTTSDAATSAEAARRAIRRVDRADALMALVGQVMRGSHAERAPVEVVISVPAAGLQRSPRSCAAAFARAHSTWAATRGRPPSRSQVCFGTMRSCAGSSSP